MEVKCKGAVPLAGERINYDGRRWWTACRDCGYAMSASGAHALFAAAADHAEACPQRETRFTVTFDGQMDQTGRKIHGTLSPGGSCVLTKN